MNIWWQPAITKLPKGKMNALNREKLASVLNATDRKVSLESFFLSIAQ